MDTTLEFSYKPRLGPSIALTSFFLAGIVFMANVAVNNDRGLVIDEIITLDTGSATAFYWLVVVACLWPLFVGFHTLRLSQQKKRCIVLSRKDITVPGFLPGAPTVVVPLKDVIGLAMRKGRYTRTLVIRHGPSQTRINQAHFADNDSFEGFLSHLQAAIDALRRPAIKPQESATDDNGRQHLDGPQTTPNQTGEEQVAEFDERTDYIRRIRAAGLLDAVFLLFYYNVYVHRHGPECPPALEVSEVLPELGQPDYEHALTLAERMWRDAEEVGLAYYRYPEARYSIEEAVVVFETENPGFSKQSYGLAVNAAYVKFR